MRKSFTQKCESCNIQQIEVEQPKSEGLEGGIWDTGEVKAKPYKLCFECRNRLKNYALRPLELFNLVAIHGHTYYLHDDFYDYDAGEAIQPEMDIVDSEHFPFPKFEDVKNNLSNLIDYSFVQYFTEAIVIEHLQKFDKIDVLNIIDEKVKYNNSISYKAYEIVSDVVGKVARDWASEQWENREEDASFIDFAELISNCFEFEEAFELIKNEVEKSDNKSFNKNVNAFLYLKSEKTLDWLETNAERIMNVSSDFGQLAASSQFSWQRCDKWLSAGRPLSLIALDALYLCTTKNYMGESIWLQKLKPTLIENVKPEIISNRLHDYLKIDSVPRTKNAVSAIMYNLYEAE